jgi:hypothetical protein
MERTKNMPGFSNFLKEIESKNDLLNFFLIMRKYFLFPKNFVITKNKYLAVQRYVKEKHK